MARWSEERVLNTLGREPVESSNLAAVGYDPLTHTLELEFRNGRVYQYYDVPEDLFLELMDAPSQGTYFNKRIRDQYEYKQIK